MQKVMNQYILALFFLLQQELLQVQVQLGVHHVVVVVVIAEVWHQHLHQEWGMQRFGSQPRQGQQMQKWPVRNVYVFFCLKKTYIQFIYKLYYIPSY